MFSSQRKLLLALVLGTSLLTLISCGDREVIQSGPRYSLDGEYLPSGSFQTANIPLSLAATSPGNWSTHLSNNSHQMPNAPLSTPPQLVASVELGINARKPVYGASAPIIVGNQIYHYDAAGYVNAVSLSGNILWRTPLIPLGESIGDGFGGGVAYDQGRLYVATGYGEVVALDAGSGGVLWRYKQAAPLRKAPLVSNGRVVIISEGTKAIALNAATGAQSWRQYSAQTTVPSRMNAGVPAAQSGQSVLSYATGELQYVNTNTGNMGWNITSLGDQFYGSKSQIGDVSGDPVISGGSIYAGTASGVASVNLSNGQTQWSNPMGTKGPLIVSGNSVFGISPDGRVYRISSQNGQTIWAKALPKRGGRGGFGSPKLFHYDPRLVNGQIWVFDNRGTLRRFDAATGGLIGYEDVPKLAQSPVFGNGAMVAMGARGQLLIFR